MSRKQTLEFWTGEFGDEYTERNATSEHRTKILNRFWGHILGQSPKFDSILEVGANVGDNLRAIQATHANTRWVEPPLYAVEPNARARLKLQSVVGPEIYGFDAAHIDLPDNAVDMVFTSGVLIHIHPDELLAACQEIYRVARRYIICIEYFAPELQEMEYRGNTGVLWKQDFGSFWLQNFDLRPLAYEFFWEPISGMNNVTFWLMEKPNEKT